MRSETQNLMVPGKLRTVCQEGQDGGLAGDWQWRSTVLSLKVHGTTSHCAPVEAPVRTDHDYFVQHSRV